jgi:hypothetical protein
MLLTGLLRLNIRLYFTFDTNNKDSGLLLLLA